MTFFFFGFVISGKCIVCSRCALPRAKSPCASLSSPSRTRSFPFLFPPSPLFRSLVRLSLFHLRHAYTHVRIPLPSSSGASTSASRLFMFSCGQHAHARTHVRTHTHARKKGENVYTVARMQEDAVISKYFSYPARRRKQLEALCMFYVCGIYRFSVHARACVKKLDFRQQKIKSSNLMRLRRITF